MITIVKFDFPDQPGPSDEYVPLAEFEVLETHTNLLARETYELKVLLRRVIEISLLFDDCYDYDTEAYRKLNQLILDCEAALK
jgi:hypothetical protein